MVNVLLLGCDGNAGMNYAKCLKKELGDNVKIHGTGFNTYHLKAAEQSSLFEAVYNVAGIWTKDNAGEYGWVTDFVDERGIDFVHAQPEEEVDFLCDYGDNYEPQSPPGEIPCFGKSFVQRNFFENKVVVQKFLGQKAYLLSDINPTFNIYDGTYWIRANNGAGSKYALPVTSWEQAVNWAEYLYENDKIYGWHDLSVTKYLPGREFAVQLFFIDGVLYHMQQRERVEHFFARQMVSGQSSTPSVAVTTKRLDVYQAAIDVVTNACDHLSQKHGFDILPNGIYGVDMRCNEDDEPVITEVNYGRYFTTSDFFAEFGINTPVAELLYATENKEPEFQLGSIREGIYWTRGLDRAPVWYTVEDLEG